MTSKRSIVLLGAGGFLGSHLTRALARRSDLSLQAVDTTFAKLDPAPPGVALIEGSVTDNDLVGRLVDSSDLVVSMTALCNPALYNTRPVEVIHASFSDLVPLVEACARAERRLVHFSTCEVYGKHLPPGGEPLDEEQSPFLLGPLSRERWTYACAKQLLERLLVGHRRLPFTIIRPFNVIGPQMDFIAGVDGEGAPRVLACLMQTLLLGRPLPLVNGGTQRRAFIAVEDFTEAVIRIIDRPDAAHRQVFNIGNPENDVSIAELAELLARCYHQRHAPGDDWSTETIDDLTFYGPGYDDVMQRIPAIDKARRLLDWRATTPLAQMLPAIVDDYVARYAHRMDHLR